MTARLNTDDARVKVMDKVERYFKQMLHYGDTSIRTLGAMVR